MSLAQCYHCGDNCTNTTIVFNDHSFCCNGCKTVYEILNENDLQAYYDLEESPGITPEIAKGAFDFLDNQQIAEKLLEFNDDHISMITFYIPSIHCSACIWVLEHLNTLNTAVINTEVNFPNKQLRITFNNTQTTLKAIAELLGKLGYKPHISLEDTTDKKRTINRSLIYKLAVAGFAFGNVMLMSFPEYFQSEGFWLDKYKPLFRTIIFLTIIPVVFYAANDYFISAYKGLKHKFLNIDVPIALGISVLFLRSAYEIFSNTGQGYFDSLAGFVFFLLLGRIFQQQTYSFLSFERDYKSYFPIAVTKLEKDGKEANVSVYDVKKGDKLLIRNNELIPIDGILISKNALIDYSFVTGESIPVRKESGDKLFAGGKQLSGTLEMEVLTTVSQSKLTQLWNNDVFTKGKTTSIQNITDAISQRFTLTVIAIAFVAGIVWYYRDPSMVANVVTAVLIVACPCALALSAPFALGNMLRIFGKRKMYLKNTEIIENLSHIDTIIFDKTGTITTNKAQIVYDGSPLNKKEKQAVKSVLRKSNHPLSRMLYEHLENIELIEVNEFKEELGKGIEGMVMIKHIKLGSASFVNATEINQKETSVFISIDGVVKGVFLFDASYRENLNTLINKLTNNYELGILSGDSDSEKGYLQKQLPETSQLIFNQKPEGKLKYIQGLQDQKKQVLMVGDGLNDAGALAQSNVGLVISENINVFSPASDGIIDASKFSDLYKLLKLSKKTMWVIKISFVISLLYNLIGMYFAIAGLLSPIIAAILMPLSSITVVSFVTIATNHIAKKYKF